MQDRRSFLKTLGGLGLAAVAGSIPLRLLGAQAEDLVKLTILSTNDVHSRIEPFPANDRRNAGLGGFARRAKVIKEIRAKEDHVLLLDAGDIFQGTPYFNMFGGELELKLMSEMGYDAATMGNHDFDNGLEGFLKVLPNADFPFLTANYDFSDTILAGKTQEHLIIQKGPIKVGLFGIGVELNALVSPANYGNTVYLDPVETANRVAAKLREQGCDLVICISHLGYKFDNNKVSDVVVAKNSTNIDLIVGGHTHTFMKSPDVITNKAGKKVLVSQTGWGGINLGKIDFYFSKKYMQIASITYTTKKIRSQ
jgi:5'-nucleotidase